MTIFPPGFSTLSTSDSPLGLSYQSLNENNVQTASNEQFSNGRDSAVPSTNVAFE